MQKTILKGKTSKGEYLYDIILSGENKFDVSSQKTISKRRIEKGVRVSDTATIEPTTIQISGVIADVPTLWANLETIPTTTSTEIDTLYRGIAAGYYLNVDALIETNPKKFSDDYRKIFTELITTLDVLFDIYNPKDNTIIYENFYLHNISISEIEGSSWGFNYSLSFQEIILSSITSQTASGGSETKKVDNKNNSAVSGNTNPEGEGNYTQGTVNDFVDSDTNTKKQIDLTPPEGD